MTASQRPSKQKRRALFCRTGQLIPGLNKAIRFVSACILVAFPFHGYTQDFQSSSWDVPVGDSMVWEVGDWQPLTYPRLLVENRDNWAATIEPRGALRDIPEAGAVQTLRGGWAAGLQYLKRSKPKGPEQTSTWQFELQLSHFRVGAAEESLWDEAWSTSGASGAGWASVPDGQAVNIARAWATVRCRLGPSSAVSIGYHPNHWGRGWRSVWLDRQAAPLPQLQYHVDGGRVRYSQVLGLTTAWTHGTPPLTDPTLPPPAPGRYKNREWGWMAAHLVEVDLGRGFHGELFGAVKWLHKDSAHAQRFEWTYAIPFVSFRPTEYMLGSADNALVGLGGGWQSPNSPFEVALTTLLDEFVLSEMTSDRDWWANKWAVQITVRGESRDRKWRWLAESIAVRPFTYGHAGPGTAWVHGNAPLAHPAGANFIEHRIHGSWRSSNGRWHVAAGGYHRRQGIDGLPEYAFNMPDITTGANPRVGYNARPADYGISMLNTGLGQVDNARLAEGLSVWGCLARDIPKVSGHRFFLRGISGPDGRWRLEAGLSAGRVWEERIW